jgi:RNase adaptor protein for sRNA GlmZ degradation
MPLTVQINSFSYKKSGIPKDETENGGGFVFDCRFMNNPGRQTEFKEKHGKDSEIIEFLNAQDSMQGFLKNVYSIIDPAIENFIERGFSNLMISFGCTGGQHRSIYSAERTKDYILQKYPGVNVVVKHREFEHLN